MLARASRSRLAALTLSAATIAGGALTVVSPAYAATTVTASPVRYVLPGTDTATDVLAVGQEVWIAEGNSILIASPTTGKVRRTVTGVLGAKGLTLAEDGQSVYVSSSTAAKIVQISTAGDILGSWASQTGPGKSAIVGGALYYAYGSGVGRMDLTTHDDASVAIDDNAAALTAAGSTLVTYNSGAITSYTVGDDGSLTKNAITMVSDLRDAELSPDGTRLVTTRYSNGYGLARYDAASLTLDGTFTTDPYPSAVAWSPDGSKFAGIEDASYEEMPVRIFSDADGSLVTTTTPAGGANLFWAQANEASWSADGKYIYSLAQGYTGAPSLVVTPTAGQAKASVAVSVKHASAYGKNLTVTVHAAGRAHAPVTLTVTQAGAVTTKTVTTDASGTATWSLPAKANGSVTATAGATLTYLASTGTAKFTTPSKITGRLSGYSSVKGGVAHFSTGAKVRANLQVLPARAAKTTVTLQYRSGSSWKNVQTSTFTTSYDGYEWVGVTKTVKKVTFRFVARVLGDSTAVGSPSVVSQPFTIG